MACPKCGQKVSGDETFAGASVPCPVCSSEIHFPGETSRGGPTGVLKTEDYSPEENKAPVDLPGEIPDFEDVAPQASQGVQEKSAEKDSVEEDSAESEISEDDDDEMVVPTPVSGAISLVASVLGVVLCIVGGILFSPIAIIFGHISQAKARHSPVQPAPGQTLGAIGMLIGYAWLVITILILGVLILFEDSIREMVQSRGA